MQQDEKIYMILPDHRKAWEGDKSVGYDFTVKTCSEVKGISLPDTKLRVFVSKSLILKIMYRNILKECCSHEVWWRAFSSAIKYVKIPGGYVGVSEARTNKDLMLPLISKNGVDITIPDAKEDPIALQLLKKGGVNHYTFGTYIRRIYISTHTFKFEGLSSYCTSRLNSGNYKVYYDLNKKVFVSEYRLRDNGESKKVCTEVVEFLSSVYTCS